jgi:hypothetical protein
VSNLGIALAIVAGFILGVRVGIALGHRSARQRREVGGKAKKR